MEESRPTFVDFFAGSGLVTQGFLHACEPVWSNDICAKKAAIYTSNHGTGHFHLGPIERVSGGNIPRADIVWASFPCQDLSLAGKMGGLAASRSGLFWEWIRVIDEMNHRPAVLALENVVGLLSANEGNDYRLLHEALTNRGYRVGPMLLNARHWVPQSRPRVFVVAARSDIKSENLQDNGPNWIHPEPVCRAISNLNQAVWWAIPKPKKRVLKLSKLIDWDAPVFDKARAEAIFALVSKNHKELLSKLPQETTAVFPGYRRTRQGKQVLELRFDDISGCLRTAEGGSSRQILLIHDNGTWKARLITPREAALLMGAPKSYKLSSSYNESYNAMGDAVVVPVVKHLVDHLLVPLYKASHAATLDTPTPGFRRIA